MTEREKVINGLDCCLDVIRSRQFSSGCGFCPYVGAEQCKIKMIEDAIALLKAQEPVEPLAEYSVHTGSKWAICGKCHEPLAKASDKEMPNYCPGCGRAVKWDG